MEFSNPVATFKTPVEAESAKKLLESKGIASNILPPNRAPTVPGATVATRLMVQTPDVMRARDVLVAAGLA